MYIGHGNNQVSIDANIISVTLSGSFNEYGFRDISDKVKAIVSDLGEESFCILVNHLELLGATPEAYQELEALNIWLNQQSMLAKAVVIKLNSVMDTIKSRSPALSQQNMKVFESEDVALEWLQLQLQQARS